MIKTERQYHVTRAQAKKFSRALAAVETAADHQSEIHPALRKAEVDGLQSQLEDLRAELEEYEALRSGEQTTFHADSFDELPRALIKARVALGLSQRQLAERLGLKEQQVQRYEATEYASASLTRIREVIDALGIRVREEVVLPGR